MQLFRGLVYTKLSKECSPIYGEEVEGLTRGSDVVTRGCRSGGRYGPGLCPDLTDRGQDELEGTFRPKVADKL